MLLDTYEPLFFNANFKEAATDGVHYAYRGELILVEGDIADDKGRRKPPVALLKQAAILTDADSIQLLTGSLDALQDFPALLDKFGAGIKAGSIVVLYTVNIPKPFIANINATKIVFIPLVQGMAWNELIDAAALEKSDFKGQTSADKVVTLYQALIGNIFKYPEKTVAEALTTTNNAKRENHGAI